MSLEPTGITMEEAPKRQKREKKPKLELPKRWVSFFARINAISDANVDEWTNLDFLAYFGFRFKKHFGRQYSFDTAKRSPSSSSDVFFVSKLANLLQTTNPNKIKNYIDWVFDHKVIRNNRKITSFGYFINNNLCNEYFNFAQKRDKTTKSTELPKEYQEVINLLNLSVGTWGDLLFVKQAVDANPIGREEYQKMFNELYKIGFEFNMLEGLNEN